jgi:hypothetical protein
VSASGTVRDKLTLAADDLRAAGRIHQLHLVETAAAETAAAETATSTNAHDVGSLTVTCDIDQL